MVDPVLQDLYKHLREEEDAEAAQIAKEEAIEQDVAYAMTSCPSCLEGLIYEALLTMTEEHDEATLACLITMGKDDVFMKLFRKALRHWVEWEANEHYG